MIPDNQVIQILIAHFPELKNRIDTGNGKVYKMFDQLTSYALSLWEHDRRDELKSLYQLINELFYDCQQTCRNAIENILIYRTGTQLKLTENRMELMALLPEEMKAMVRKLLIPHGI